MTENNPYGRDDMKLNNIIRVQDALGLLAIALGESEIAILLALRDAGIISDSDMRQIVDSIKD